MATSSILILELTGKKRRLVLTGGGLPFRGPGFGGEQTLPTQWYPGNRRATQQVLAPKLTPADWQGMWRTPLLLRSPCYWADSDGGALVAITFPYQLWQIFESLRDEGQLLRVEWTNTSAPPTPGRQNQVDQRTFKVVRIGRIGEFEPKPDNLDDIGWSANFVWIGKGDTTAPKLQSVSDDLLSGIQAAINSNNGVAELPNNTLRAPPNRFTLGTLAQMTQAPLQMVDSFAHAATSLTSKLQTLGDIVLKVRDIPASMYGRALDVANTGVSTANNFMDQISRQSSESLANRQKVSMLTRSLGYYHGAMTQAQLMASSSNSLAATARRKRRAQGIDTATGNRVETGDVMSVYMPRQGDTMQSIARRFYGEDLSAELAKANGLKPYLIAPPKTALVIPVRAVLDRFSQRVT